MRYFVTLSLFIVFLPTKNFAQQTETDITGLWKGTTYNDTTQQLYRYEIGISEVDGKLSGFSYVVIDSGAYYGLKKLKVTRDGSKVILEDAGILENNYPVKPEKGVRQLSILQLEHSGSELTLKGTYVTNATKKYHPLTGSINLSKSNNTVSSDLIAHLERLKLADENTFVKIDKPIQKEEKDVQLKAAAESKATALAGNKSDKVIAKNSAAFSAKDRGSEPDAPKLSTNKGDTIYNLSTLKDRPAATKSKAVAIKKIKTDPVNELIVAVPKAAALDVNKRVNITQQTVSFKSDSLQLALYDNGEVDGDIVSVLMNGNIIMSKERLSTNAVRKTIYIPQNTDTVELVMYAENLGLIPPNTGLLVVKDGKDLYEIRFSGDLQKNAAIIFKRKKEQ